jgi:catecholate siderophore receptor
LRAIVAAQPGITLGTGENGNAFGDRYVIRGQEARSDVFIDSLRDPGMTIRESFAVEQVEITKGPNSSFAGRGSSGGTINSITKRASSEYQFNKAMSASARTTIGGSRWTATSRWASTRAAREPAARL